MTHPNLEIIARFFDAYSRRDNAALSDVLAEDVRWTFPGRHPLSGTKTGVAEVVAFFDSMGSLMGSSNMTVEVLVSGVNDHYVVETQHILVSRADGNDLDHIWCVLWRFENGKISAGRHLASDQAAVDAFFEKLMS